MKKQRRRRREKKKKDRTYVTCFNKSFRKFDIRASNFSLLPPPSLSSIPFHRRAFVDSRANFSFCSIVSTLSRRIYLFPLFFSLSLSLLLQSIPVFRITFYTQLLFIKAIRRLEYIDRTVTRVHYHPENHGCSCRVRTKKRERKKKATRMEIKNDRRGTGRLAIPTVFKRYQFLATILTSRRKSFTSCIFHFRSKIKYHWKGLS